jgi:hypothetical protein
MNEQLAVRTLGSEFRALWKALDDHNRRAAATFLKGKVHEIDGDLVRLELAPPDGRGKRFLSPKVKVQEMAGRTGSRFPVKKGDPMWLLSPNGELGSASMAIRDAWTDDAPAPNGDNQELVLAHDGCEIRMKGGKLTLVGDTIAAASDRLTHNDRNVGFDHRHRDVVSGPELTGEPV